MMPAAEPAESPGDLADHEIVRLVLQGETAVFAVLVQRYQAPLLRLALSRGLSAEAADEVVQETFLAAYRYLAGFDPTYSFRTWLWTILLNQSKRRGLAEAREREHRVSVEQVEGGNPLTSALAATPEPSAYAEQQEDASQLLKQLKQLPDAQADALRLRFFGGATFPEIAQVQQCSLATAKNRVRAGLDALALVLTDDLSPADHSSTIRTRTGAER